MTLAGKTGNILQKPMSKLKTFNQTREIADDYFINGGIMEEHLLSRIRIDSNISLCHAYA